MASDIRKQVSEMLFYGRKFSLQTDESTDISNNIIVEQLLSNVELITISTSQDIYSCVSDILDKKQTVMEKLYARMHR